MALIFPGQRLVRSMSTDSVKRLGLELRAMVEDMEREAAPEIKALSVWWKWYEATPRDKEKTFPFKGASNVVVPLIGITVDALSSRALAQATAAAPQYWSTRTEDESKTSLARNIARYINWQADGNDFSLKHVLSGMFPEMYVGGRSVAAINYRHDQRPLFFGRTPLGGSARVRQQLVTFAKGPMVEHVPREHMLWDTRVRIGDAPAVVRKHEYMWVTLREQAKADPAWDEEAVKEIRKHPGLAASESRTVAQTKDDLDLRDRDPLDHELHDVREIWIDWSMLSAQFEVPGEEEWGGAQVPLVAHLHMNTGRILRLVGNPYLLPYKPFVDFRFREGRGIAKRLEMLQSIQTTIVNQEIDAGTRRNALWGKTRNARHNRSAIDPSKWMLVDDMGEVEPFVFPNQTQSNLSLLVAMQTISERWMGQSDPLLGRDTRSGGHPAPATSTLALLEQTNVMSAGTDVIVQEELSRMGECIAILDQQFEDNEDGKLVQVLGARDAAELGQYLFPDEPIPGNYTFDVVALSRTDNPDAAMRRTLMTAQAYQNYGALAAQGAMVIGSPQAPPQLKAVWAKLMDGYGQLLGRFLDAANVDDGERYLIELEKIGIDSQNAFRQFAGEAARAAQAGGGGPQLAGGGGAVAAPGGSGSTLNGSQGRANGAFAGRGILA